MARENRYDCCLEHSTHCSQHTSKARHPSRPDSGDEDYRGILLDDGAVYGHTLLRILGSRQVSFRQAFITIRKHHLPTEEGILSILYQWRHLWTEAGVCGKLTCNYPDVFRHGPSDMTEFASLFSTLPKSDSWIHGSDTPLSIPFEALFRNIMNQLKLEPSRAVCHRFELTVKVGKEEEALFEDHTLAFLRWLKEGVLSITLSPSIMALRASMEGAK